VYDVGHLAATRGIESDDAKVVDGAAGQIVVHQTYSTVGVRRPTATTSFTRRLKVHHILYSRIGYIISHIYGSFQFYDFSGNLRILTNF